MEKKILILITAALIAFTGAFLSGCGMRASGAGEGEEKASAVSLVIGNHACSMALNLNSPAVKEMVSDAIRAYGFVSLVNADGDPELVAADNYDIPERFKHADETKLQSDADAKTLALLQKIGTVSADTQEVDMLESIRIATRSLANAPQWCRRAIIVIDTGLSTTGFLDFRNNLLEGDPAAIVRALSEKHAIPDLTGTTVYWQQMGDVGAPQAPLSPAQRIRLEEIWRAVIEAGGGTLSVTQAVPNNAILGEGLPAVSVVELKQEEAVQGVDVMPEVPDFNTPVVLGTEEVRFVGDSAEYADRTAAEGVLSPVAEYLKEHKDLQILIVGTTAGDENGDFEMNLSSARAGAVRTTLEGLGVDGSQMIVLGMGSADPWHIEGVGTTGAEAEKNRKVVLLDVKTEEAQMILQGR